MQKSITLHVGLDVHTDSIDIATADPGRDGEIRHVGTIGGDLDFPEWDQAVPTHRLLPSASRDTAASQRLLPGTRWPAARQSCQIQPSIDCKISHCSSPSGHRSSHLLLAPRRRTSVAPFRRSVTPSALRAPVAAGLYCWRFIHMVHPFRKSSPKSNSATASNALLNEGLALAMEWGPNWLVPIQERLGSAHPDLSPQRLNEVNQICQAAMRAGHALVEALAKTRSTPDEYPKAADFKTALLRAYPWINEENASLLFSQGMYYLLK